MFLQLVELLGNKLFLSDITNQNSLDADVKGVVNVETANLTQEKEKGEAQNATKIRDRAK